MTSEHLNKWQEDRYIAWTKENRPFTYHFNRLEWIFRWGSLGLLFLVSIWAYFAIMGCALVLFIGTEFLGRQAYDRTISKEELIKEYIKLHKVSKL